MNDGSLPFAAMLPFLNGLRFTLFSLGEDVASRPKFDFTPTFIFCSPICPNNCGVVFFVKIYFSFREIIFLV